MTGEWKNTCPNCGKILDGTTFDYGTQWLCSKCAQDQTDVCTVNAVAKCVLLHWTLDTMTTLRRRTSIWLKGKSMRWRALMSEAGSPISR